MKVAYRIDGHEARPPLVLASSLGTTWELWDAQLPSLVEDFRVVRYDHPGHGRSPIPDASLTVESLADGVVELIDALDLERVSFCGLSLGGMVGMALALRAPERVDRLVLCCTAAHLGPVEGWYERAEVVRARGTSAIADAVLGRWFTERFRDESPVTIARFREMLEGTPAEGYAACCEAIARWDARSDVSAIRAPTLVISGDDDVAAPPRGRRVSRRIDPRRRAHGPPRVRASCKRRTARPLHSSAPRASAGPGGHGGDMNEQHEQGMKVRREVLGDEHVDRAIERTTPFTADFQDLITRYAWGEIWARPGLDRRTRSCITLATLVALGREEELAMHVRAALRVGLTPDEIKEVLLQSAIYCGVPAANGAFAVAQRVLDEVGPTGSD